MKKEKKMEQKKWIHLQTENKEIPFPILIKKYIDSGSWGHIYSCISSSLSSCPSVVKVIPLEYFSLLSKDTQEETNEFSTTPEEFWKEQEVSLLMSKEEIAPSLFAWGILEVETTDPTISSSFQFKKYLVVKRQKYKFGLLVLEQMDYLLSAYKELIYVNPHKEEYLKYISTELEKKISRCFHLNVVHMDLSFGRNVMISVDISNTITSSYLKPLKVRIIDWGLVCTPEQWCINTILSTF